MLLKQYYLGCLAHASYLITVEASGRAAVVDPQRDVGQYIEDAARQGCRIGHVFLTHFHADFVAAIWSFATGKARASTWVRAPAPSIRLCRWPTAPR